MDTVQFIARRFDISKLKSGCNVRGCSNSPTRELLLLEFDRKKPARSMASLYLCEKHCASEAESIPRELKADMGKQIGGRIYDIRRAR